MSKTKYKIIALFGPAGSGKDFIQKKIMETDWGQQNLNEIISCTTRPPRENEVDGTHYHFISHDHFLDKMTNNQMLEYTEFRNWYYGTPLDSLNIDKVNIGVFNIAGIKNIMFTRDDCEVLPLFIHTYDKLRLMRQLVREINPDCHEICRRYLTDANDYIDIPFSFKVINNETDEIQPILDDLKDIIIQWTTLNN